MRAQHRAFYSVAVLFLQCIAVVEGLSFNGNPRKQQRAIVGERHVFSQNNLLEARRGNKFLLSTRRDEDNNVDDEVTRGFMQSQYIPVEVGEDDEIAELMKEPGFWSVERLWRDKNEFLNIAIAVSAPLIAFSTYEYVAKGYSLVIDMMSSRNWVAVDGGKYGASILLPALNGVVLPAIAVLFATLTSTTVSSLRARQLVIREAINKEAGELRALEMITDGFPEGVIQDRARSYLIQYTTRVIQESNPLLGTAERVINSRRATDNEMNGFYGLLNQHYDEIPNYVADQAYNSVVRLRQERKTRISALQSGFPTLHYIVLGVSACAETLGFLMETDQGVLLFLNGVQLKILWSMLITTFVLCFVVFSDLANPFTGSYRVDSAVNQLHTIRQTLIASMELSELQQKPESDMNGSSSAYHRREKELQNTVSRSRHSELRGKKRE